MRQFNDNYYLLIDITDQSLARRVYLLIAAYDHGKTQRFYISQGLRGFVILSVMLQNNQLATLYVSMGIKKSFTK